jgi:two-component system, LytTR family, sensor histidine kinase AlgZ
VRHRSAHLRLPDFCSAPAAVAVILIVVVTAVVLSLARQTDLLVLWLDLARTALFLLWIGLGCAAILCSLRARLEALPIPQAAGLAVGAIVLVVSVVSAAALWLGKSEFIGSLADSLLFPTRPWRFMVTNMALGAIVGALALRYFYVLGEWQRNVELQARARVQSLQARIRPHFLYNSMNTIAALTRTDPSLAEEAVQDLADLFRANLSDQRGSITLREELEVARIYQRIEQLRLGERLQVVWNLTALPMHVQVPSLLLQPLLENAIYHGIEPQRGGGVVTVDGSLDGEMIGLTVRNPLPDDGQIGHAGHRLALANIRERMELMYQGRASIDAGPSGGEFIVRLRFPATL